ncbi:MAG: protease SohB, partial [Shewanella sp.]
MEFLYEYGMFLAKAVTIVVAIVAGIIVVLASTVKHKSDKGELRITNLSEELQELKHSLKEELLTKKQFKAYEKQLKAEEKAKEKADEDDTKGKV